jgi:trk system potassium uptake protein TrkH
LRGESAAARLEAAWLFGAGISGLLGQLAVDMPGGYFGPWDTTTTAGRWFCVALIAASAVGVLVRVTGHRSLWMLALVPSANVMAFLQPLASDPVPAGLVVGWNLVVLGRFLFPRRAVVGGPASPGTDDVDALDGWLERTGHAVNHLVSVALVATVAVVGYQISQTGLIRVVNLVGDFAVVVLALPFLINLARRGSPPAWLALVLAVAALPAAVHPELSLIVIAACLSTVAALLVAHTPLFSELLELFFDRPALLVLVSFLLLISLGTVLLSFPAAAAGPRPVAPIDALFTATSAACVTGLIVLDTPNDFSAFGQAVILMLIQIGGLNIMVLSTFAAIMLGRGLGLKGDRALGELLDLQAVRSAYRLIVFIVVATLVVEGVGAVVLGAVFLGHGSSPWRAVWSGVFHSVSAFCNAGFALQSDSLVQFGGDPLVLLTVAALITLGGLGFPVLAFGWLRVSARRRIGLAVQVKVVLAGSLALILIGWLAFGIVEWSGSLAGMSTGNRVVNAFFQSVTARTAGFNSVPFDDLRPAATLLLMALMFIGASPGGTGGGIKTTTIVVLLSAIPAVARGRPQVVLFGRRLTLETVYRSAVIAVVGALVVFIGAMLLLVSQPGRFDSLLFEAVSAFGTVGLSLGATSSLNGFGKIVVIGVMLAGRIGPLALALLLGRSVRSRLEYPEARLMVG